MCFYDVLQRKTTLLSYKTTSSYSQKIEIFPKGLVHGFGPKLAISPCCIFKQYRPGKCVL